MTTKNDVDVTKLIARLNGAADYEFQTDYPQATVLVEPSLLHEAVAALERALKRRDDALTLAELSWQAAWGKACRQWESDVLVKLPKLQAENEELKADNQRLREALRQVLNELGVPDSDYPAPVANAVEIASAALAAETNLIGDSS